jgi:hypothetical protein
VEEYSSKFAGAPFPLRLAPPGTTGRLRVWLNQLASEINVGAISPAVVAWVLNFFLPLRLGQVCRNSASNDTQALDSALTAAQPLRRAPVSTEEVSRHLSEPDAEPPQLPTPAHRVPGQSVSLPNAADAIEDSYKCEAPPVFTG